MAGQAAVEDAGEAVAEGAQGLVVGVAGRLPPGYRLKPGMVVLSPSRKFFLVQQTDGNLVVYSKSRKPLWASGTSHHAGAFLEVQNDSNAVIYSKAKKALWATHT